MVMETVAAAAAHVSTQPDRTRTWMEGWKYGIMEGRHASQRLSSRGKEGYCVIAWSVSICVCSKKPAASEIICRAKTAVRKNGEENKECKNRKAKKMHQATETEAADSRSFSSSAGLVYQPSASPKITRGVAVHVGCSDIRKCLINGCKGEGAGLSQENPTSGCSKRFAL